MEDSIDKELNSLEEIEQEDKLFSQMIEEHYRHIDYKKRVGFRWFVCLWIGWVLCLALSPVIGQRLGLSDEFFPGLPLIYTLFLVLGQWKYFVPLERGEAILNFIEEDWSRSSFGEKFSELSKYRFSTPDYRYKVLKLHSALTIILQGYHEKCHISGFEGLKPVVSRLQLLSDHQKGKDRKPRPLRYSDYITLLNRPFLQ